MSCQDGPGKSEAENSGAELDFNGCQSHTRSNHLAHGSAVQVLDLKGLDARHAELCVYESCQVETHLVECRRRPCGPKNAEVKILELQRQGPLSQLCSSAGRFVLLLSLQVQQAFVV